MVTYGGEFFNPSPNTSSGKHWQSSEIIEKAQEQTFQLLNMECNQLSKSKHHS